LGNNTERPITLEQGTNVLAGSNPEKIIDQFKRAHGNRSHSSRVPSYWDGNAARRIIEVLLDDFYSKRSLVAAASGLESRSASQHPR
jgi:UDP-N-acetylglucosamine 2-epimerase (non-hydrolysing)